MIVSGVFSSENFLEDFFFPPDISRVWDSNINHTKIACACKKVIIFKRFVKARKLSSWSMRGNVECLEISANDIPRIWGIHWFVLHI